MMELDCPGLASDILDQIETNLGLLNPTKADLLPIAPLSYLRSTKYFRGKPNGREVSFAGDSAITLHKPGVDFVHDLLTRNDTSMVPSFVSHELAA
jgi:hypothetical protein